MRLDIPAASAQALLTLLNMRGIGRISAMRLGQRFATLEAIFAAGPGSLKGCIPSRSREAFCDPDERQQAYDAASRTLETAERIGVQVLTYQHNEYPLLLRQIEKFPLLLYVKGTLRSDGRNIACVGTRNPSHFGEKVTERLVRLFVEFRWGIVSGLAPGIDTMAHQTALASQGYPIAVLASGLDTVYPKQNTNLAEAIVEAGGCLVSDQPFGTKPLPAQHIQCNRIQSGLSLVTVPMQTATDGGTMHTILFTLLQHRRLYVPVPPETYAQEPQNQGLLALLNRTGPQLATLFEAEKKLPALLQRDFADRPVARPITGRDDYPVVLQELDELYTQQAALFESSTTRNRKEE